MKTQQEIEATLQLYNEAYREGNPVVTDIQYDILMDYLKANFPNSELLKKGVIEEPPTSRKEKLPLRMASLNKCKSLEEVKNWLLSLDGVTEDSFVVITPKLDGISLVVNEGTGQCWTRGDGFEGQKSDNHFRLISFKESKPKIITFGEAIMEKSVFDYKYSGKYKSARNLVAGLFNRNIAEEELLDVNYIRYGSDSSILNKVEEIEHCNDLNNSKIPYSGMKLSKLNIDGLYEKWGEKFQIDGLVIDINSAHLRSNLGREENGNPAYARALKLPEWTKDNETVITGHKFSMSKQGKLKGTVIIDPVIVDGVTLTQATFYNAQFLFDWGLSIGRKIEVKRSGDVIPKIVSVEGIHVPLREEFKTQKEYQAAYDSACELNLIKFSEDEEFAKLSDRLVECPCCGKQLHLDQNMVELVCVNENCKDIRISKIFHFFNTIGLEDFGEPKARSLYFEGFNTINSLMLVDKETLSSIDGWGESSANTFISQRDYLMKEQTPLARMLHALDLFDGVFGEKTCQSILDYIYTEGSFDHKKFESLTKIRGVEERSATVFIRGWEQWNNICIADQLSFIPIYYSTPIKEISGTKMLKEKVCMTGFRSNDISDFITSNGGEVVSGISKNTTLLIVDDLNTTSSKAVKARETGCRVVTKEYFETNFMN